MWQEADVRAAHTIRVRARTAMHSQTAIRPYSVHECGSRCGAMEARLRRVLVAGHRRAPHIGDAVAPLIDAFGERTLDGSRAVVNTGYTGRIVGACLALSRYLSSFPLGN